MLTCSWYLILDPVATKVRDLHAEAGALLSNHPGALDAMDSFRPRAERRLYQLGVRGVRKLVELHPPQVVCEPDNFDVRDLDPQDGRTLTKVVEELADRKVDKLARVEADERQLFVWIDFLQKAALADLGYTGIPRANPTLPAPIDNVWIAEAFSPGRVLAYGRHSGWTDHGTWQSEIPEEPTQS